MRKVTQGIVFAFIVLYILLLVIGVIKQENRLGTSEYILIAFIMLFAAGFFDKLSELSFGKDGFSVRLSEIEERQDNQENIIIAIQIALRGLVTKYEYEHLIRLSSPGPYYCKFGHIFFEEIKRLDALGFIRPAAQYFNDGFNLIKQRFETNLEDFNLKEYVQITEEGEAYIKAKELLLHTENGNDNSRVPQQANFVG